MTQTSTTTRERKLGESGSTGFASHILDVRPSRSSQHSICTLGVTLHASGNGKAPDLTASLPAEETFPRNLGVAGTQSLTEPQTRILGKKNIADLLCISAEKRFFKLLRLKAHKIAMLALPPVGPVFRPLPAGRNAKTASGQGGFGHHQCSATQSRDAFESCTRIPPLDRCGHATTQCAEEGTPS
jgi:hypothetical protein